MNKKKYLILTLATALFFFTACERKAEIIEDYQDKTSSLISLLVTRDDLDKNWVIEKIISTQVSGPTLKSTNLEEMASRGFWGKYSGSSSSSIHIEQNLFRYSVLPENLKDLPFDINGSYQYLGQTANGVDRYSHCERIQDNNICVFASEFAPVVSVLSISTSSKSTNDLFSEISAFAEPLLNSIELKLTSWNRKE